ncbi:MULTISPECIES: molybdopterin converting factor subunit 1 [Heyndrickxia]|jgi:molybdopterin synthase sulfur carrier subunit|uniref:molybdopterin converting factor subunit 1 n=1 Tax=Heyndrickxia TaxID=2837504 RepID=UPI0003A83E39|nr:molybdopterin converting factor subunit 1 [Heyndrickxia oleronia]MCI1593360.1 molybdopterin converting factor subunit 1 [Heyndrickxia oleronia]MCI1615873.1 molybdopterin converting factor subunit 1 [Heyndrickxia oleronia]MCI1746471.1 molybdopterin converting factor subunit 1 [Heyndrickxia oleronia]MCI1764265.1 molybdopterin converting factor subunit 1 [Heyndrickxia oleronia]
MIKVMLFAQLREQVGEAEIKINAFEGSVNDLLNYLHEKYSLLNIENLMIAVNEEFSPTDKVLQEGDVVALIPPVSGG